MVDDDLLAATPERAAEIAGVTLRQVDYWDRTGLVSPSVRREISPRNVVRLYGFADLVELYSVGQLLRQNITLQHVRSAVEHLRAEGIRNPLREVVFATHGREIYFQRPDGSWAGGHLPDQIVIRQFLPLEEIRAAVRQRARSQRSRRDVGRIVRKRRVHGSQPVLAGTRVPVEAVAAYLERGYDDARILRAYPLLEPADIEAVRETLVTAS
ncbi:MAG: DUF433 domain-containing protein [Actinomycetota bacterium]